ncbi:MAG: hypothetical protein J6S89_09415 [Paludibacteraceae bacterium]|nr:hypothetical protein [Paludibacteraceae bacterium]
MIHLTELPPARWIELCQVGHTKALVKVGDEYATINYESLIGTCAIVVNDCDNLHRVLTKRRKPSPIPL